MLVFIRDHAADKACIRSTAVAACRSVCPPGARSSATRTRCTELLSGPSAGSPPGGSSLALCADVRHSSSAGTPWESAVVQSAARVSELEETTGASADDRGVWGSDRSRSSWVARVRSATRPHHLSPEIGLEYRANLPRPTPSIALHRIAG